MATAAKTYKLVRKASSQVGKTRIERGGTITEAVYKKLDARRKAYYDLVEAPTETPKSE